VMLNVSLTKILEIRSQLYWSQAVDGSARLHTPYPLEFLVFHKVLEKIAIQLLTALWG